MKINQLQIGDLVAKIPIIQGGMGVGISLGNLAGAVAKEGGIGIISSAQIGFKEDDFRENTLKANIRAIKKEFDKARKIAPNGVIGFNIMVALKNYKEQVQAAVKAGADVIISGAGLPIDLPEYVKGAKTKIAPIVSSVKSAKVILKMWEKRYNRTADFVVIEGPKAGGHLGFKKEEIVLKKNNYDQEVKDIHSLIKQYEEMYEKKIPVILAGGINTQQNVRHALELGMDGVQVASRFVTTKECDADIAYKQCYIKATSNDIEIVQSPVGMPGRAINNQFMKRVSAGEKFPPKKCLGCLKKCNPRGIPYCITERLINAAVGNVEEGLIFCGAEIGNIENISTVHKVIKDLMMI